MNHRHTGDAERVAAITPYTRLIGHLIENAERRLLLLAAVLMVVVLAGCKVTIDVPQGGRVEGSDGTACYAGESCTLNISTTSFHHNFTAIADQGFSFAGWTRGGNRLCGSSPASCLLSTLSFGGNANLLAILASDQEFFLQPEFEAAATDDPNRYDPDVWGPLLQQLNSSNYRSDSFLFQVVPDTGNCDPGVLTSSARMRFLDTVNLIRKLHYLPPVEYEYTFGYQAQQAALVQLANNYLTHYPASGDTCYTGGAATGAGSSNLSYRSQQGDPAAYPLGWVNDNYNISSIMEAGHRRWVLYPDLGHTVYGQARGYASMKVFGFGLAPGASVSPDVEYVAVPYQKYPYVMVSKGSKPTPWSISMIPPSGVSSRFEHFANATVTVVNSTSGAPLSVHSEHSDTRGYGLANLFSWMVDDWEYDTWYTVTISNVLMQDSSVRTIEYQVEIDYAELQ